MIDLSEIVYRAFQEGDVADGNNVPAQAGGSTFAISLSAIKYRASFTDPEEEEEEEE